MTLGRPSPACHPAGYGGPPFGAIPRLTGAAGCADVRCRQRDDRHLLGEPGLAAYAALPPGRDSPQAV